MAKVKVKTHSGAKKRFKITGTGKVKLLNILLEVQDYGTC